ncbi:hypothetical protein ABW21_db0201020 [Orbilia brochopaga]|nr:hypothetical protein ABW21_db0201020 [Drechslerella brochopaga]
MTSLNPSAPPFKPPTFVPRASARPFIPSQAIITVGSKAADDILQATSKPIFDRSSAQMDKEDSDQSSTLTALLQKCSINDPAKQAANMQQKLERLVYLTTRDVFVQSLFKAITRLSSSTAQHILKNHVKELPILLKLFKMDDLVDAVVSMHGQRVYSSPPEVVQQKWPWLLLGDIAELSLVDITASNTADFGVNPSGFTTGKHPEAPSTVTGSMVSEDVFNFDSSNEQNAPIDPYTSSFPYPTQRTILKESQRILKAALYAFTKQYLPDNITNPSFEYPASSSLGQWVLMVQDAISTADIKAAQGKLVAMGISFPNLLDPASELHDLLSRRQHITTAGLRKLLENILKLTEILEAPECISQQRALNGYASALAEDLKKKLEEIQIPFRNTMKQIADHKDKLARDEKTATEIYREQEKLVQKGFLLDPGVLKSIISPKVPAKETPMQVQLPADPEPTIQARRDSTIRISSDIFTPSDVRVWGPDKQVVDFRAMSGLETIKARPSSASLHPAWDPASLDLALEQLSHKETKENRNARAEDVYPHIANSRNPSIPGPGLEGSKYASGGFFVPPKRGKFAIPIKAPPKDTKATEKEKENGLLIQF